MILIVGAWAVRLSTEEMGFNRIVVCQSRVPSGRAVRNSVLPDPSNIVTLWAAHAS